MSEAGDGGSECAEGDLGEALAALKREGCAFLVTGEAPPATHAAAAEQFLGTGNRGVVLLSDDAHRPGPTAGDGPAVVRYETEVRSGVAAAGAGGEAPTAAADLHELGVAVLEEIETYEATNPERSPGGFRLVLLSAAPILADHDDEQVFSWLHLLLGRVRKASGMAFVHLPVGHGDPPVPTLRPLFDGRVEVRPDAGGQYRWLLDDHTSDWMDI
ncbi:MAG: hypothetical protein ABEH77_09115 [Halobacteriaceae archaeon]